MTVSIDPTWSLGRIAAEMPAAARVFHARELDFCCGGTLTLRAACEAADVPLAEVLSELSSLPVSDPTPLVWDTASSTEVIDHLLEIYHVPEYAELDRICALVDRVCTAHQSQWPKMCQELGRHWFDFLHELLSHFRKEEEILFPLMRRVEEMGGGGPPLSQGPLRVMLQEHDAAAEGLATLRRITSDYTPPAGADAMTRALFEGLASLDERLGRHIHIENHVLFPRFD